MNLGSRQHQSVFTSLGTLTCPNYWDSEQQAGMACQSKPAPLNKGEPHPHPTESRAGHTSWIACRIQHSCRKYIERTIGCAEWFRFSKSRKLALWSLRELTFANLPSCCDSGPNGVRAKPGTTQTTQMIDSEGPQTQGQCHCARSHAPPPPHPPPANEARHRARRGIAEN